MIDERSLIVSGAALDSSSHRHLLKSNGYQGSSSQSGHYMDSSLGGQTEFRTSTYRSRLFDIRKQNRRKCISTFVARVSEHC